MDTTRTARHAATSRSIERAAVRLVLDRGIDAVTVDMICAAAGISQRTFFNHFPTKNAAILGREELRIDEAAVRRFLASDAPDLLAELLELVASHAPGGTDPELAAARWTIITREPALMRLEMERLLGVQRELSEVLALRLARRADPGESEADIRAQASLLSHMAAGIVRYAIEGAGGPASPQPVDLDATRALVARLLPKLGS